MCDVELYLCVFLFSSAVINSCLERNTTLLHNRTAVNEATVKPNESKTLIRNAFYASMSNIEILRIKELVNPVVRLCWI